MRTLPLLDALHALPSTIAFREDLARLGRTHPGAHPTHVNLTDDVITAVCFATPTGPVWAGLESPWSPDRPPLSSSDQRRIHTPADFSGWTRAELRTALVERPDPADPWHQAILHALNIHLTRVTLF